MRARGFSPITWADQSEWFEVPKQQRSRDTMQRVFDSAIKLFASRGFEQTSTEDIAADAGVTKGSIYRRFPDKEALLYTIIEAYRHSRVPYLERLVTTEQWADGDPGEVIDFYLSVVIGSYRQDTDVIRIIERRALVDPKTFEMIEEMNEWLITTFSGLLAPWHIDIGTKDVAQSVRQAHTMIRSTLVHLILADEAISRERIKFLHSDEINIMLRKTFCGFLELTLN